MLLILFPCFIFKTRVPFLFPFEHRAMASTLTVSSLLLTLNALLLLFLLPQCMTDAQPDLMACKFDAIYNVGDSMSDTGNLVRENSALPFARLPYGETFFKNATGRCSNGLLMIDYIGKNRIYCIVCFVFSSLLLSTLCLRVVVLFKTGSCFRKNRETTVSIDKTVRYIS